MKKALRGLLIVGFVLGFSVSSMAAVNGSLEWNVEAESVVTNITASKDLDGAIISIEWEDNLAIDGFGIVTPKLVTGPLTLEAVYNLDTSAWVGKIVWLWEIFNISFTYDFISRTTTTLIKISF